MTTITVSATGLTCGHCAHAVQEEISAIPGVQQVTVRLEAGGTTEIDVVADPVPADSALSGALQEAGDYILVGTRPADPVTP